MNDHDGNGGPGHHQAEAGHYAQELVHGLNSLLDGDQVVSQLIACGPAAIPAVKSFLLLGKPGVLYQPRVRAVEVLGALGAKDALIAYLTAKKGIPDPAVRMAEEIVENAAARQLARWQTQDVLDILMQFARPRSRSGIVEALAQFRTTEAIPYFLHALEDDICRSAAEEALRGLGRCVEIELIAAARQALPSPEEERPSSLRRRTAALGLLAELGPAPESWPLLRPLMDDSDAALATVATRIAVRLGNREDRQTAVERLLTVLPAADWYVRLEIEDCLASLYDDARSRIEEEVARRSALPKARQISDPLLATLLAVRRRNLPKGPA